MGIILLNPNALSASVDGNLMTAAGSTSNKYHQSGSVSGILPITGTPHFIDSSGKVPNVDSSSIQTEIKHSFKFSENSS
jgi:hypothetical protein